MDEMHHSYPAFGKVSLKTTTHHLIQSLRIFISFIFCMITELSHKIFKFLAQCIPIPPSICNTKLNIHIRKIASNKPRHPDSMWLPSFIPGHFSVVCKIYNTMRIRTPAKI